MATLRTAFKYYPLTKEWPHSRIVELTMARTYRSLGYRVGVPPAGWPGYDLLVQNLSGISRVQVKGSDRPLLQAYFSTLEKSNVKAEFDLLLVSRAGKSNPFSIGEIVVADAETLQKHIHLVKHRRKSDAPYITAGPLRQFAQPVDSGFLLRANVELEALLDTEELDLRVQEAEFSADFKVLHKSLQDSYTDLLGPLQR